MESAMREHGTKFSSKKMEWLRCREHNDSDLVAGRDGEIIQKYIGSTLADHEELNEEDIRRVLSKWKKWRRECGALCNRQMNVTILGGGEMYRTAVRPALLYTGRDIEEGTGKEIRCCWNVNATLRWTRGATAFYRIRSERIRTARYLEGQRR